jgi:hypothetical protein
MCYTRVGVTDNGRSVYSLFSALIMHVYQMRSSNQSIVSATQHRIIICMTALKDVSKVWLVAKMVHTLFESILGNKVLEERLQKAAGRRHQKNKPNGYGGLKTKDPTPTESSSDTHKRKFEEMEFGYSNGPPAPQMSYERSRPQSPNITPSRDLPTPTQAQQTQQGPQLSTTNDAPQMKATDAFMGASRSNTRPTTPFMPYSIPGTPPDLFLHTRNSPKISDDLWQNYQPDQLFPPETNGLFPLQSPNQNMVDPALRQPPPPQHPSQFAPHMQTQPQSGVPLEHQQMSSGMSYHQDPAAWAQLQAISGQQQSDDQYSNSSYGGPIVPTTLNVGDWFEFFGIPNGGIDGLGGGFG